MTWATIEQVKAITGRVVTDEALAMASSTIDIYCNRTEAASGSMGRRDLEWLKRATAYQAIWQPVQAGYDERHAVGRIVQDGVEVDWQSQAQQDLAPLAIRSLKNLSWKGSRSVNVPSAGVPVGLQRTWEVNYADAATDDHHSWESM